VNNASRTVDTIHNKLSVLRDAKEPAFVKDKSIDYKIDPETEDSKDGDILKYVPLSFCFSLLIHYRFEPVSASPCRVLIGTSDATNPLVPWVIRFNPSDIPMQLAKRKAPIDKSTGPVAKHAKLEVV